MKKQCFCTHSEPCLGSRVSDQPLVAHDTDVFCILPSFCICMRQIEWRKYVINNEILEQKRRSKWWEYINEEMP